jgi:hypothetical protein
MAPQTVIATDLGEKRFFARSGASTKKVFPEGYRRVLMFTAIFYINQEAFK